MLKVIILGFLNYRPMSGYDLENWMSISTANFWHAKLSQIYTTLKGMEKDALVSSHIEPQEGRPDRRVYTITETGQAHLQQWLSESLLEMPVKKDTLLVKVFFGLSAGKDNLLTQLRLQLDLHQRQKQVYEQETPGEMMRFLADQPELVDHTLLWDLARQYGIQYEEMYIRWLQDTIAAIEDNMG